MARGAAFVVATLVALACADTAQAEDPVARGKYLAEIMDCTGCHTPGAMQGKPDMTRYLGGGDTGFEIPGLGIFYPPNLTPDPETGLGQWSEEEIVAAVTKGMRPDGRQLVPIMPWPSYGGLNRSDARALAAYLKTLPIVAFQVPGPLAPGAESPLPYFHLKPPQ